MPSDELAKPHLSHLKNSIAWRHHVLTEASRSVIASLTAGLAIAGMYWISARVMYESPMVVVASMGAAAIIVFQFPGSPAARPWPIIGGHVVSAIVGITLSALVTDRVVASGLAVGLSLLVMHVLRCMHPPGGGTALVAVIGGTGVHHAGYRFVLFPTLVNAVILACLAVGFSWLIDSHRANKGKP